MDGSCRYRRSGQNALLTLVLVGGLGISAWGGQPSRQAGASAERQGSTASMPAAVVTTSGLQSPAPGQGARSLARGATANAAGGVQGCLARVALTVPTIT
jgi:hypothetical protein